MVLNGIWALVFVSGSPGNSNAQGLRTIDLAFSLKGCEVMDNVQVEQLALERRTGSLSFDAEGSTVFG